MMHSWCVSSAYNSSVKKLQPRWVLRFELASRCPEFFSKLRSVYRTCEHMLQNSRNLSSKSKIKFLPGASRWLHSVPDSERSKDSSWKAQDTSRICECSCMSSDSKPNFLPNARKLLRN